MSMVDIDEDVYNEIKKLMDENIISQLEYPSIKNFINRSLSKMVNKIKDKDKEEAKV